MFGQYEWVSQIRRRLAVLFRGEKFHSELDEEMQAHLEMQAEENRESGMSEAEARYSARRQLGNLTWLKEEGRDQWGWSRLEQFGRDLKYSARTLRKNPGYTAAAVLTLALGIGANCLLFSIVDPVILRPFPYPHPERLVFVWSEHNRTDHLMTSLPDFLDWTNQNHAFESMGAWISTSFDMDASGYPEQIPGQRATSSFFMTLGIQAQLGRTFTADDEREGKDRVVVISDRYWRTRLRADPQVIGSTLLLRRNSAPAEKFTVIGVLPPALEAAFPKYSEIWGAVAMDSLAMAMDSEDAKARNMRGFNVLARLKPGVTLREGEADLRRVAAGLRSSHADTNTGISVQLLSFHENLTGYGKDVMTILMFAVAFVLLLACANVANLALARGTDREREMTVRAAIGASRGRLFRQMLTESLVLSVAGGALGALLAFWAVGWGKSLVPVNVLRSDQIGVDGRVLLFTLAVSMITGALFGMLPSLRASRANLNPVLQTTRGGGRRQGTLRDALVVAEMALGFVLIVGAGLMINSFIRLMRVDPGFDTRDLLAVEAHLPRQRYHNDGERLLAIDALVASVGGIPGVRYAGITDFRPLGNTMNTLVRKSAQSEALAMTSETVAGDYFAAMGTRLIRGRLFTPKDAPNSQAVAIVNEAAARRYWPGEDPIGKSLLTGHGKERKLVEIVGIVASVRRKSLDRAADPAYYVPQAQAPSSLLEIVVRPAPGVPPMTLATAVRKRMADVDRTLAASRVTTMEDVVAQRLSKPRFLATILAVFGFLALALTATGVFGVMAYTVRARRHEFGVRMALGADSSRVVRLVLRRGGRLVLLGLVIGLLGSVGLTRVLASMLYEVKPMDPATLVYVCVLMIGVAMAANYVPARRATKIDAWVVLRSE